MTAPRHAPAPPRWPASHVAVGLGAWVVGAAAFVMGAVGTGDAISPRVDVSADQPRHVPPRSATASIVIAPPVVPSVGALPTVVVDEGKNGSEPAVATVDAGSASTPQTTPARPPATATGPAATLPAVTTPPTTPFTPPIDTTRPTDIPTSAATGPCFAHIPATQVPCSPTPTPTPTSEPPVTTPPASSSEPPPSDEPTDTGGLVDDLIDIVDGTEEP